MKIFIAGGGTGGHIYPAIAIAKAIKDLQSDVIIDYVGTASGLETKIIPKEGAQLHLITSGKLNFSGNILEKIKTLIKIHWGLLQSVYLVLKHKPDFVLGVGGYASAPFVLAASLLRKPTAIWEPNAHPGMANRLLSRFVNKAYLVFPEGQKYLQTKVNMTVGMPLRYQPQNVIKQPHDRFTVLCFGGSQGSQFLNDKISDLFINNPEFLENMHLIHQTGPKDYSRIKSKYEAVKNNLKNVEVHEYIYNMPEYYLKSDVLFCRGGASTLAEAGLFGVVPIIVPLPAADNHQQKNAESLVNKGAAFMFLQDEFHDEIFKRLIWNFYQDPVIRQKMTENLRQTVPQGASQAIAADILKQIR